MPYGVNERNRIRCEFDVLCFYMRSLRDKDIKVLAFILSSRSLVFVKKKKKKIKRKRNEKVKTRSMKKFKDLWWRANYLQIMNQTIGLTTKKIIKT